MDGMPLCLDVCMDMDMDESAADIETLTKRSLESVAKADSL